MVNARRGRLRGEIAALLFPEVIQGLIDQKPSAGTPRGQSVLGPHHCLWETPR